MSIIDFIAVVSFGLTCFSIGYTYYLLSLIPYSFNQRFLFQITA